MLTRHISRFTTFGIAVAMVASIGWSESAIATCTANNGSCANPSAGYATNAGCCSNCCETFVGGISGVCVDSSQCPAPPTPTPTPTSTPTRTPVTCAPSSATPIPITSCRTVSQNVILTSNLSAASGSCLTVSANNITIDGSGYVISATSPGASAISWQATYQPSCVTIKNVNSSAPLQIYGQYAHFNTVTNSTLGSVSIQGASDNVIENSTLGSLSSDNGGSPVLDIEGLNSSIPAERETISNNVIQGVLSKGEQKLVKIASGPNGTNPDRTYNCAVGGHLITNNQLTANITGTGEPELLWYHCGTQSTISGNTLEANGLAAGMLIRDSADDNTFEDNTIHLAQGNESGFFIQSGSAGYHHPQNNTIRNNRFFVDSGRVLWVEAAQSSGNSFDHNLFASSDAPSGDSVSLTGVGNVFDHNTFYRGTNGTHILLAEHFTGPVTLTNNIFASYGDPVVSAPTVVGYQGNHNVFFRQGAASEFHVNYTDYNGLSAWQSFSGQDSASRDGDPQFVNPSVSVENFNIGATSAARCAAADGGDAGAYPYTGGGSCPPTPTPQPTETPVPTPTPAPTCVPNNGACSTGSVGSHHDGACCSGCCFSAGSYGGVCSASPC